MAGHVLGKVGHWGYHPGWVVLTVMGWAGQVGGGKFANWDIAVLQASCTGAEKKGFTELNKCVV